MSRQGAFLRGAAALLLAHSSPAVAADEERAVELEEVEVRLPRPQPAAGPTSSATVIEAQRYIAESKSIAEIVATAPGVAVQDYGGLGHLATVSIRGSSADQVVVLLDGMPLNTAAGGGVDLSSIPREWIDRIEVVRGAEGAHYGSGALGGVVNIITKPAVAGAWSAQASGGSFLTFSGAADAATGADGWAVLGAVNADGSGGRFPYVFDSTLNASGGTEERLRDNNGFLLAGGLIKAWLLAGRGRVDALLQLSGGHRELPGWPTYLTPNDWQDDARAIGRVRYARPVFEGFVLSGELSGRYDRLDARLRYLEQPVHQRGQEGRGQAGLTWARGWSTLALTVLGGVESLDASGMASHSRPLVAAMISEEASLAGGQLHLSPAIRLERLGPFQGISGKLGMALKLAGPLSLRVSGGRTFRAPSFAELYLQQGIIEPNPNLRPEISWSGDAALVAEGPLGLITAGAFVTLYQDLIVYEAAAFRRLTPRNDDKAIIQGIEVEVASTPLRRLLGANVAFAYTFMQTETLRGVEGVVGNEVPRRPRHRLYARLGFEQGPAEAHVDAQYVGTQWQEERNVQPIAATFLLGAGASVRIVRRPAVRLHLDAKNALDDRTLQDGFANPLPARMVLFSVRASSQPEE